MDKENEISSLDIAFGVFFDECRCIHSESSDSDHVEIEKRTEDSNDDIFDDDMQWLSDIGFAGVIGKYKDHAEIDTNDAELRSMTATLTQSQSATVRKRIESLNDTMKRMKKPSKHADVRSLFPIKTDGQISKTSESTNRGRHEQIHATRSKRSDECNSVLAKALPGLSNANSLFFNNLDRQSTAASPRQRQRSPVPDIRQELSDYRQAIDKNMNVFYSIEPEQRKKMSKSPQPVHVIRPPPPRRAKSEGVFQIQGTGNHRKSPSADNPISTKVLASYTRSTSPSRHLSPSASQANKPYSPSRSLDFNRLDHSYTGSPKQDGVTKHKSEEDLNRLRARNGAAKVEPRHADGMPHRQKISQHSIDGDAKLNIGSDSIGKDTSSLFNGQAFPLLPNFSLKQEKTGMTRISDLSEQDMSKVRSLALIELTALFDNRGIAVSRRKHFAKYKQKENGIFGVALSLLLQKDHAKGYQGRESQAPRFFKDLVMFLERNGLREEGILRVSGSQQRIKALREEIEECYGTNDNFIWQGRHARDMATILKQFLRELPTPLLTHEYQRTFIAVSDLNDRKLQLQALNLLVLLMPSINRDTLQMLLRLLSKVVLLENDNRMDLNNVSMIMAPNLFLQPNNRANLNEIHKLAATTDVMRMLIKYHRIIWMVPDFMVTQIRYLNEAGSKARDAKAVKKIIAKRMKSETVSAGNLSKTKNTGSGDELDCAEGDDDPIIRVKAPMFNKICMAIQLMEDTTAADIIARFRSKRNSIKELTEISRLTIGTIAKRSRSDSDLDREEEDSLTLYEIGGNIGERRLDPNTNMMALLKINPNAEWLLKALI